jgi:hypothetical protein
MLRREHLGPLLMMVLAASAFAQTEPTKRTQVAGTVSSVNADVRQITLKTDKGGDVSITTSETTLILRIPPGETDPKKGAKTTLSTLSAGDRAVVIGPLPTDPKRLIASAVLIMSKSDVASLHQRDQDDWKMRGSTGMVTAIDAATHRITIKSGPRTYVVQPTAKTTYHRYSPDSARFADAKVSSFAEIQNGDQLRVLGNKDDYRAEITAEKIVFGSFRQLAATVTAMNAQSGELTVKDLASKKTLTIRIDATSTMRRLPENASRMLARRYAPGAEVEQPPAGAPGRGGRGGMAGGDIAQMLDNLPAMPLTDLKPGDAIMVSTTQGSDPGRVTAITLLAGVEPLLTASPSATRDIMSGWNLGGNGDPGQ